MVFVQINNPLIHRRVSQPSVYHRTVSLMWSLEFGGRKLRRKTLYEIFRLNRWLAVGIHGGDSSGKFACNSVDADFQDKSESNSTFEFPLLAFNAYIAVPYIYQIQSELLGWFRDSPMTWLVWCSNFTTIEMASESTCTVVDDKINIQSEPFIDSDSVQPVTRSLRLEYNQGIVGVNRRLTSSTFRFDWKRIRYLLRSVNRISTP